MDTKTVLITGAIDGIGKETARQLSDLDLRVLVHGRNEEKLNNTANEIGADGTYLADFSSMSEVTQLAEQIIADHNTLDVLINNAGVAGGTYKKTVDGFENIFAVNYLSHWLLTQKLLPILEKAQHARIIHVSSNAHQSASLDMKNLNSKENYRPFTAYSNSKLAQILYSLSLSKRLPLHVTTNSLHPGVIRTKLLRAMFPIPIGKNVRSGAQTSVYLATSDEVTNITGAYFVNEKQVEPSLSAQNENLAEAVWQETEALLKPWL